MKSCTSILLSVLSLAGSVAAWELTTPDQYCFLACRTPFIYTTFTDEKPLGLCASTFARDSVYLCARKRCTPDEIQAGLDATDPDCLSYYGGVPWAPFSVIDNITSAQIDSFPVIGYPYPTKPQNSTVIVDDHLFEAAYITISQTYDAHLTHYQYSYAMFIFWGIVCGLGVFVNALNWMRSLSWDMTKSSPEGRGPMRTAAFPHRVWTTVRARFLLPAVLKKDCAEPVLWRQGSLAPRAESVIIVIYIIINVVLCSVSYVSYEENLYEPTIPLQTWRYIADRTGYLAYANLAIFWLFAVRNNVLLWLTGWNFNTFNHFHRWVARLSTLQAVLHSIAYTVYAMISEAGEYEESWTEEYYYTGQIATICMALMIGASFRVFRVMWYEMFLLVHIGLSLMVIVNLFYHTKIFLGQYDGFLWPCVAFWVFDRVLRIGRFTYSAVRAKTSRALVEHSAVDDILRMDVTGVFASRAPRGGSHYFLYAPLSLKFWESHPFTLVRWESAVDGSDETPPSSPGEKKEGDAGGAVVARSPSTASHTQSHYSFIVRPRAGFTSRLRRTVEKHGDGAGSAAVPLLYEGGYGHLPDLRRFADVLLIIGGSGASLGISAIYDVLDRSPGARIHLVFASRTAGLIDGIMDRELRCAAASGRLTVDAFVTGDVKAMRADNYRSVTQHRPDCFRAVREAVHGRSGALAVVVCGPGSMMDDARLATVNELKTGQHDVQLFLESFEW